MFLGNGERRLVHFLGLSQCVVHTVYSLGQAFLVPEMSSSILPSGEMAHLHITFAANFFHPLLSLSSELLILVRSENFADLDERDLKVWEAIFYLSLFYISTFVLHPTKEGQFPRDPIFFGQTPHP